MLPIESCLYFDTIARDQAVDAASSLTNNIEKSSPKKIIIMSTIVRYEKGI